MEDDNIIIRWPVYGGKQKLLWEYEEYEDCTRFSLVPYEDLCNSLEMNCTILDIELAYQCQALTFLSLDVMFSDGLS